MGLGTLFNGRSGIRLLVRAGVLVSAAASASAAPVVANGDFQNGLTGWTGSIYTGVSGYNPNGSSAQWDNGTVPGISNDNNLVAFVEVYGPTSQTEAFLRQTISGFEPGVLYQLEYLENSRALREFNVTTPDIEVFVGGVSVVPRRTVESVGPQGSPNSFYEITSSAFTVASGSAELEFRVYLRPGTQDSSGLFDNVSLAVVPEPSTLAFCGLGGLGLVQPAAGDAALKL